MSLENRLRELERSAELSARRFSERVSSLEGRVEALEGRVEALEGRVEALEGDGAAVDFVDSLELVLSVWIYPLWDRVRALEVALESSLRAPREWTRYGRSMRGIRRAAAESVLEECGGNKTKAARVLEINRKTLISILEARSHAE